MTSMENIIVCFYLVASGFSLSSAAAEPVSIPGFVADSGSFIPQIPAGLFDAIKLSNDQFNAGQLPTGQLDHKGETNRTRKRHRPDRTFFYLNTTSNGTTTHIISISEVRPSRPSSRNSLPSTSSNDPKQQLPPPAEEMGPAVPADADEQLENSEQAENSMNPNAVQVGLPAKTSNDLRQVKPMEELGYTVPTVGAGPVSNFNPVGNSINPTAATGQLNAVQTLPGLSTQISNDPRQSNPMGESGFGIPTFGVNPPFGSNMAGNSFNPIGQRNPANLNRQNGPPIPTGFTPGAMGGELIPGSDAGDYEERPPGFFPGFASNPSPVGASWPMRPPYSSGMPLQQGTAGADDFGETDENLPEESEIVETERDGFFRGSHRHGQRFRNGGRNRGHNFGPAGGHPGFRRNFASQHDGQRLRNHMPNSGFHNGQGHNGDVRHFSSGGGNPFAGNPGRHQDHFGGSNGARLGQNRAGNHRRS